MKKIMSLLIGVTFMALIIFPAIAEVDVKSSGAKVTTATAINFQGPAVTKSGSKATVDMTTLTGDIDLAGSIDATGTIESANLKTTGSINWTDAKVVGTNINWTDTKSIGSGVNWASLDFQASSGINWVDPVNLKTTKGKGSTRAACFSTDGTIYFISAGKCF